MKLADIRKESLENLHKLLSDKRIELVEKKRSLHQNELQNPSSIKVIRRDIAAILTVIGEQQVTTKNKEEA